MTETAVIAAIRYNNERINYGTGISIVPKLWNKYQKEARAMKGILHTEFNASLRKLKNRIEEAFRRFCNDTGRIPSKTELKEVLDKEFERKSFCKKPKMTFIQFIKNIILTSKEGTRLQPNGRTISANTLKTYNTTLKHLKAFAGEKKKT